MKADPRDSDAALLRKSGRRAEAELLARPVRRAVDPIQEMMGCPTPVWLNGSGDKLRDGRCAGFSGTTRCSATATHTVWIGCTVGEHLDKSEVCEGHAAAMPNLPTLHCKRCWDVLREVSDATIIKIERIDSDSTLRPGHVLHDRHPEGHGRRDLGLLQAHAPDQGRRGGVPVETPDQAAGTGEVQAALAEAPHHGLEPARHGHPR